MSNIVQLPNSIRPAGFQRAFLDLEEGINRLHRMAQLCGAGDTLLSCARTRRPSRRPPWRRQHGIGAVPGRRPIIGPMTPGIELAERIEQAEIFDGSPRLRHFHQSDSPVSPRSKLWVLLTSTPQRPRLLPFCLPWRQSVRASAWHARAKAKGI
jgi:hypothetical protein